MLCLQAVLIIPIVSWGYYPYFTNKEAEAPYQGPGHVMILTEPE